MLTRIISNEEALRGFSSASILAIGALFVVAAALEETRAAERICAAPLGAPRSERRALLRLCGATMLMSAFMNNTPIVAILLSVCEGWATRNALATRVLLMPLSFASMLGGMCTLVGTSTNLVLNALIQADEDGPLEGFSMFSMTPVALPGALFGLALLVALAPPLLRPPTPKGAAAEIGAGGGGGAAASDELTAVEGDECRDVVPAREAAGARDGEAPGAAGRVRYRIEVEILETAPVINCPPSSLLSTIAPDGTPAYTIVAAGVGAAGFGRVLAVKRPRRAKGAPADGDASGGRAGGTDASGGGDAPGRHLERDGRTPTYLHYNGQALEELRLRAGDRVLLSCIARAMPLIGRMPWLLPTPVREERSPLGREKPAAEEDAFGEAWVGRSSPLVGLTIAQAASSSLLLGSARIWSARQRAGLHPSLSSAELISPPGSPLGVGPLGGRPWGALGERSAPLWSVSDPSLLKSSAATSPARSTPDRTSPDRNSSPPLSRASVRATGRGQLTPRAISLPGSPAPTNQTPELLPPELLPPHHQLPPPHLLAPPLPPPRAPPPPATSAAASLPPALAPTSRPSSRRASPKVSPNRATLVSVERSPLLSSLPLEAIPNGADDTALGGGDASSTARSARSDALSAGDPSAGDPSAGDPSAGNLSAGGGAEPKVTWARSPPLELAPAEIPAGLSSKLANIREQQSAKRIASAWKRRGRSPCAQKVFAERAEAERRYGLALSTQQPLRAGDTLLLCAPPAFLSALRADKLYFARLHVLKTPNANLTAVQAARLWFSIAVLVVMLTLAGVGTVDLLPAAICACFALVGTGCLSLEKAWRSIAFRQLTSRSQVFTQLFTHVHHSPHMEHPSFPPIRDRIRPLPFGNQAAADDCRLVRARRGARQHGGRHVPRGDSLEGWRRCGRPSFPPHRLLAHGGALVRRLERGDGRAALLGTDQDRDLRRALGAAHARDDAWRLVSIRNAHRVSDQFDGAHSRRIPLLRLFQARRYAHGLALRGRLHNHLAAARGGHLNSSSFEPCKRAAPRVAGSSSRTNLRTLLLCREGIAQ